MNTRTFFKLTFAVVLVGALATYAIAADWTITANIPFDFQVGATRMPAGLYKVSRMTHSGSLLISSKDNQFVIIASGSPLVASVSEVQPKVVFNRYGDHYFMGRVVLAGGYSTNLPKSKLEVEYQASASTATVTVAAGAH